MTKEELEKRVHMFENLLTETTQGTHVLSSGPFAEKAQIAVISEEESYFDDPKDAIKYVDNLKKKPETSDCTLSRHSHGYRALAEIWGEYGANVDYAFQNHGVNW